MINLSSKILPYIERNFLQSVQLSHFGIQNYNSLDFVQCNFASTLQYLESNKYDDNILLLAYQSLFYIQGIIQLQLIKNQYNYLIVYNILITINSQNVQIQLDEYNSNKAIAQFNSQLLNEQYSLLQISSNKVSINKIKYQENACLGCEQGNISINSIYVIILNSLFEKNIALNGGSLYLKIPIQNNISRLLQQNPFLDNQSQLTQPSQTLQNCSFIQNIATKNGGAIFAENSNLFIVESYFSQNSANNYGGVLASQANIKNIKDNLNFFKSKFILNIAKIGSVFFQLQNLPIQSNYRNVLTNNTATLYGNTLISQAIGYQGFFDDNQYQNNITFYNFTSGILKQNIQIQLINSENQVVSELINDITLSFEADQQELYIIPNIIKQKSGIFNLKESISVYGRLGTNVRVKITSNFNYIPIYDLQGNLINTQQSEPFYLNFQFRKLCPKGTTLVQDRVKKDFCYKCPTGTFNLVDGSKCFKCPFVCEDDQMFLPAGYWRSSLIDYTYQSCLVPSNCIGDIDRIVPLSLQSSSNRYCKQGNIGVLCLDCDIEGLVWQEPFFQIAPFRCQKCGVQFNIMGLFIAIANVAYYYFLFIQIKKAITFLKLKQVFSLLGQKIFYKPQMFYLVKYLIEYMQILSIITPLMNNFPLQIQQIILEFSNFPMSILKLVDCQLYKHFNKLIFSYWYFRIFLALTLQFLISLIITMILQIRKHNKTTKIAINLFIQIQSTPFIFKLCIGMTSFISLEGQNYIKDYPNQVWSDSQIRLIMCLILMMCQIFFITVMNFFLSSYWNNENYNIFTFLNQLNKHFWWESISIGYRMLLYLIESLFFQVNSIKSSILCCISLSYSISIFYFMPYHDKQKNFIEIITNFGFSICFGIMNYIDTTVAKDKNVVIIYCIQVVIIAYYLSNNFQNKMSQFILNNSKKLKKLRETSQKYWQKLKVMIVRKSCYKISILKNDEKYQYLQLEQQYKLIKQQQTCYSNNIKS
ncbi:hypothetical protein ABPG72_010849 [Tetrahymena utriculariae]